MLSRRSLFLGQTDAPSEATVLGPAKPAVEQAAGPDVAAVVRPVKPALAHSAEPGGGGCWADRDDSSWVGGSSIVFERLVSL